jgi:hypothetical protein
MQPSHDTSQFWKTKILTSQSDRVLYFGFWNLNSPKKRLSLKKKNILVFNLPVPLLAFGKMLSCELESGIMVSLELETAVAPNFWGHLFSLIFPPKIIS